MKKQLAKRYRIFVWTWRISIFLNITSWLIFSYFYGAHLWATCWLEFFIRFIGNVGLAIGVINLFSCMTTIIKIFISAEGDTIQNALDHLQEMQ